MIFMLQMYPEHITSENESFVKDVIEEQFSSPLKVTPWERGEWDRNSLRCGVIARKIGIYPMWTKSGSKLLTTLLQVSLCTFTIIKRKASFRRFGFIITNFQPPMQHYTLASKMFQLLILSFIDLCVLLMSSV